MKKLIKGNTIKKSNLAENSIELFTGDDVISPYDLNRPLRNIFDDQVELSFINQALIKSVFGKQKGVIKNILEEFSSNNSDLFYSFNNNDYYFRVPTGVILDRADGNEPSLKADYTLDQFNSYGFINKPNVSLMERQLASLINLDLTEDGNTLNIEYDYINCRYTINTTIDYATGPQSTVIPAPASSAKALISFDNAVSSAGGVVVTINVNGTNYTQTFLNGTSASAVCTTMYNSINVPAVTSLFTIVKETKSITLTSIAVGASGNSFVCTATKNTPSDSLIVSGPTSGYFTGGVDYVPIKNTFDLFKKFSDTYAGYNISNNGLEKKFNLEPIFNISGVVVNTPYYLYYKRDNSVNFTNISSTNSSVTDASGRFGLSITVPVGATMIGTIMMTMIGSTPVFSYIRNPNLFVLDPETIYPKNIVSNNIEVESITSKGNFKVAQTSFVNKLAVSTRASSGAAKAFTKIATFDPRQSFGTITVSVIPPSQSTMAKYGSFTVDINSNVGYMPSIIVEGVTPIKTVDYVCIEVSADNSVGNIWLSHGLYTHSLEMNLTNALGITLTNGAAVSAIPAIARSYLFERYIASSSASGTSDSYQFSFTSNEVDIVNPVTALKAVSAPNVFKVGATGISQSSSFTINGVTKQAEVKLTPTSGSTVPLYTVKGANVEISNYDADDATNRYIKIYTGSAKPNEATGPINPNAIGPAIMLDKDTIDLSADNINIWGGTFTVNGNNINFGSANIAGALVAGDNKAANLDGTEYAGKIIGGLYTTANIVSNTTIEAKSNIKGASFNSLTLTPNAIGFSVAGGSTSRSLSASASLMIGDAAASGTITIKSNGTNARSITLGGDLSVNSGSFTLSGNALGTTLTVSNQSLSFDTSLGNSGSVLYTSGTNAVAALNAVAAGSVLISGVNPSWAKVGLATHVSGVLPVANGGTGLNSTPASNSIMFGNGTGFSYTGAGVNNNVLAVKDGVVTWLSTNSLSVSKTDSFSRKKKIVFGANNASTTSIGDVYGSITCDFSQVSDLGSGIDLVAESIDLTVRNDSHTHGVSTLTACKDMGHFTIEFDINSNGGTSASVTVPGLPSSSFVNVVLIIPDQYKSYGRYLAPIVDVADNQITMHAHTAFSGRFEVNVSYIPMIMRG